MPKNTGMPDIVNPRSRPVLAPTVLTQTVLTLTVGSPTASQHHGWPPPEAPTVVHHRVALR